MIIKNKLIRILALGSTFFLFGTYFSGVITLGEKQVSQFWSVKQLNVTSTFAEDERGERGERNSSNREGNSSERYESDDRRSTVTQPKVQTPTPTTPVTSPSTGSQTPTQTCTTVYDTVTSASGTQSQVPRQSCTTNSTSTVITPVTTISPVKTISPTLTIPVTNITPTVNINNTNSQYNDGVYTGVGKYSFPGGSINYTVSLTITSGKISNAIFTDFTVSGNGKYTRAQGDTVLQKLVSTGNTNIDTVTGASGTSKAIQDAINDALSKATKSSSISTVNQTSTSVVTPKTSNTNTVTPSSQTEVVSVSHTAPNGRVFTVEKLSSSAYILIRADGSIGTHKFLSSKSAIEFIDRNNSEVISIEVYTAPNKKIYTILNDVTNGTYFFKRQDGSISGRVFDTRDEVINYINQNNQVIITPKIISVKTTPKIVTPIIITGVTPTKSNTQSSNQTALDLARAQAVAKAQAQAAAAKVVQVKTTPVVAPKVSAPVVNTTTAAS